MRVELISGDIHCEGCAASIQRSLGKLSGVREVAVDVAAKRIAVDFDEGATSETSLRERLAAVGFSCD